MKIEFAQLAHPDQLHLTAAEGWLELGNYLEANAELEQIAPPSRAHPLVLEMRYKIYSTTHRWDMAAEVARGLQKLLPNNPYGYFHLAYCLHELKQTEEAYATLLAVVEKFPQAWLIRYNLACYACQLGKLPEALQWLEQAIDLADKKDIRLMALEDLDLEPLWTQIGEI